MSADELPSVSETARRLGLRVGRTGRSWHVGPCPACGVERRHGSRSDRRGAIGVRPDDSGWRCFSCDASGTARSLARLADNDNAARDVPAPPPSPPPSYPDASELQRLFAACVPCHEDAEVSAWLTSMRIERADFAHALAAFDSELPRWARGRESWQSSGHRFVVPLYDATGVCRNVLARAVRGAEVKSLGASGHSRKGLAMADALGRWMLAGKRVDRCVIVEGEKKLAIASHLSRGRWAVLSTGSGMWSDDVAAACSRAKRVEVWTDPDDAGARYATVINTSLRGRCVLRPEFVMSHGAVELGCGPMLADDDLWMRGCVPGYAA